METDEYLVRCEEDDGHIMYIDDLEESSRYDPKESSSSDDFESSRVSIT